MRQEYSLETTPAEEKCAQVGHADYGTLSAIECNVYMDFIKRTVRPMPEGVYLAIKSCSHDFGTYKDVVCVFNEDDPKQLKYADSLESRIPNMWDKTAMEQLKSFPEYAHFMKDNVTPYADALASAPELSEELQQAIHVIENHGGLVILNEPEPDIALLELVAIPTAKSAEVIASERNLEVYELLYHYRNNSMVPACCTYGCETEADGHCVHGNPSIFISMGLC